MELTMKALKKKMDVLMDDSRISKKSRILFIDDGSTDQTLDIVRSASESDPMFYYLSFSRNFGHQCALLAGLLFAVDQGANLTISIDADLQQDINAIDQFLLKYENGAQIVYGVRNSRNTDSFFKKVSSTAFYDLMHLFGCNVIKNHADYRLMTAETVYALKEFREVNLFLRGIVPLCGFKTDIVYFDVSSRLAGESKYTLRKMINFALDGITSLSMKPIRWITFLGAGVFLFSILMIVFYFCSYLSGNTIDGWTSMIISIWALGGIELLALGIVGEYIGRTYMETKGRPRYIIKEFKGGKESRGCLKRR